MPISTVQGRRAVGTAFRDAGIRTERAQVAENHVAVDAPLDDALNTRTASVGVIPPFA